jgi:hypothetical protein
LEKKTKLGKYPPFKWLLQYLSNKQIISDMHFRQLKRNGELRAEEERDKSNRVHEAHQAAKAHRFGKANAGDRIAPALAVSPAQIDNGIHKHGKHLTKEVDRAATAPKASLRKVKHVRRVLMKSKPVPNMLGPTNLAPLVSAKTSPAPTMDPTPVAVSTDGVAKMVTPTTTAEHEAGIEALIEERARKRFELWKEETEGSAVRERQDVRKSQSDFFVKPMNTMFGPSLGDLAEEDELGMSFAFSQDFPKTAFGASPSAQTARSADEFFPEAGDETPHVEEALTLTTSQKALSTRRFSKEPDGDD